VLQDFTGISALVDLAAMRDAAVRLGVRPQIVKPVCQADLVIDHSVQLDSSRRPESLQKNEGLEYD
jgi:aconitate hydratase